MRRFASRSAVVFGLLSTLAIIFAVAVAAPGGASSRRHDDRDHRHDHNHTIVIPEADKFVPFHLTVRAGDTVTWVNNDTDDHTVVSDDAFNDAGHTGLNQLVPGTVANGGKPGMFTLRLDHAGTFVYYCRFHAQLDADNQPVAPGPDGGIQDTNGNFGTPMSGVITVVGSHDHERD
jgi:plastocyanin